MPGSLIRSKLPLLAMGEGTWAGRYRFLKPDLTLLEQYDFRIEVDFPDDELGGVTYRQRSAYRWDDGAAREVMFEGRLEGERLIFDNGRIAGALWEVDDATVYLRFGFADMPGVEVFEMIQPLPGGNTRARTWHWLRDRELYQITLVDECRVNP